MSVESKESRSTILGRGHIEILSFLQREGQGNPVHVAHITKFFSKSNETVEFWKRLNELTQLGAVKLIETSNGKSYSLNSDFQISIEDREGNDKQISVAEASLINNIANSPDQKGAMSMAEISQRKSINEAHALIENKVLMAVKGDAFAIDKQYLALYLDATDKATLKNLRDLNSGSDKWSLAGSDEELRRAAGGGDSGLKLMRAGWNSLLRKGVVIFDPSTGLYSLHPNSNHNLEA